MQIIASVKNPATIGDMSDNTFGAFIDATKGGDIDITIAEKTGVTPATVGRWRKGTAAPRPSQAVAYARAYKLSPFSALIAAGFLTEEEIGLPVTIPNSTLEDFSLGELAMEILRRTQASNVASNVSDMLPPTAHAEEQGRGHLAID